MSLNYYRCWHIICFHNLTVDTVFYPALIHALKQRLEKPKKKIRKCVKPWISKPKRVKINTTCLNGKSKSYNIWKTHFTKNLVENPNRIWSKSLLFDSTVGSCWILNRIVGHIFPFKTIVYKPKSELKLIRYHKNTGTLIKS